MWGGKMTEDAHFDEGKETRHGEPHVNVTGITLVGASAPISAPLELKIHFDLDRDLIAAHWCVKLLVDSCDKRLVKILGETPADDYTEGNNEMYFAVDSIDLSEIPSSVLANYGLLMACLVADGEEVAAVNMVVNVTTINALSSDGSPVVMREIISPLD
jgi:hypothetical protein